MEREEMKRLCERVLSFVRVPEAEVLVNQSSGGLSRFANNQIEQNVNDSGVSVSLRVIENRRVGRASCNILDDRALERMVRAAEEMTKFVPEDKEYLPLPEPQSYERLDAYVESTAKVTPKKRADAIADFLKSARRKKVTAAGIISAGASAVAFANNRGMFAYHRQTQADYSVTVMTDGSAGWARELGRDFSKIDFEGASEKALRKALESRNPRKIEPGEYDVVLEPAAVADLVMFLAWLTFGALPYMEGRSYISGKLGEKVFDEKLTIDDDVYHPLSGGMPFDFEGMPRKKVRLIENGVAKAVVHSRKTAKKMNTETTGHGLPEPNSSGPIPLNLVVQPGDSSLEEMIASTKKGILVTQFHYTNSIDPMKIILTGMTRNGTFLIKNGKVAHPIKNLRFTESMVKALSNIESIGKTLHRTEGFFGGGPVVPAMKIRNFRFTSLSEST
ncbi:MAG: TldD/PmbA family protein [Planctomycetota bacterium]|nr:TldD/PmbA family protein [Planctomycetota bacterium]